MTLRIGIFGGTFDPVHYGHLVLAEQCREQAQLDHVWFLPAGLPPHKRDLPLTDGKRRAEMLEFALAGMPEFRVDRRELRRQGPSYTVDTLRELHTEFPDVQFFLLMGGDSLIDFPTWREPQAILQLARLLVVNRGPTPPATTETLEAQLGASILEQIQWIQIPGIEIASRDLRRRVQLQQSIRFMTPRAVEQYIREHQLYTNVS